MGNLTQENYEAKDENKIESQKEELVNDVVNLNEEEETFNAIRGNNGFAITSSMAKIMEGQKGGGFYVAIIQDNGTKNSQLGVVIKYPDGEESELLKFNQGEFLQAGRNQFQQVTLTKTGIKTTHLQFAKKFENSLMEYMSPKMPIWPNVVMRTIYEKYDKLPVIKVFPQKPDIEEIYKYISSIAIEISSCEEKGYVNHDEYYRFIVDDFEKIARGLGMKKNTLICTLSSYGLISRTPSTVGGQTKTNYKGKRFYTYNICKQPSSIHVNVEKNVEGEFPTVKFDNKYLSPSELTKLKREKAEKELAEKLKIKNFELVTLCHEFGLNIPLEHDTEEGLDASSNSSKAADTEEPLECSTNGSKSENTEKIIDESSNSSKSVEVVERQANSSI